MADQLIRPHGGELVDLTADAERCDEIARQSCQWPSWTLTPRQLCDLELLLSGGFSPLRGFLGRKDFESVCASMRLADGTLWPVPVTLDVPDEVVERAREGGCLALRDPEGVMLAAVQVDDVFRAPFPARPRQWCLEGRLEGVQRPIHYDFPSLRHTPAELRGELCRLGWRQVICFQTQGPLHRTDQALILRAADQVGASVLVHLVVGAASSGDPHHYTRVRCHQHALSDYPPGRALLSLLPLDGRGSAARDVLWSAIVAKNHGGSHILVVDPASGGGDPAPGLDGSAELLKQHADELGVTLVPCRPMVYVEELDSYVPDDEVPPGTTPLSLTSAEQARRLNDGIGLPTWFTSPLVAEELRRSYPPRSEQGLTVFFTGLSGSGKSTLANVLLVKLLELGGRQVTLLDGDTVRRHLSSELGFSKEHRDLNVRRIGFVASEITKNGGIAICAPIAPYEATRRDVRSMVEAHGGFLLVHVATPIEICEQRDRKGLYAKARAGLIKDFTGVSDPYEQPSDAEVVLDTVTKMPEDAVAQVIRHLQRQGYLPSV